MHVPWRICPALPCPATGSWPDGAFGGGCAQKSLRGVGIWAVGYLSSTCPCLLKPATLGLGVSKTAEYLRIFWVSNGTSQAAVFWSQQEGKEEEGGKLGKWDLGPFVSHTGCKVFGGLTLTSLKGRVQGTPQLDNRGNNSENQVGCCFHPLVRCHLRVTFASPGRDFVLLSPSTIFCGRKWRLQWALSPPTPIVIWGVMGNARLAPRPLIFRTGLFPQHVLLFAMDVEAPHLQNRLVTLVPGALGKELTFSVWVSYMVGNRGVCLNYSRRKCPPNSAGV